MTEYVTHDNTSITEISDYLTRNEYIEQAKKLIMSRADDISFLPIAKEFNDIQSFRIITDAWGHRRNKDEVTAISHIMQKTLERTFEQGDSSHDSDLIIQFLDERRNGTYEQDNAVYKSLTVEAVYNQIRKDREWFGKLTPTAQLAAVGAAPDLCREDGLNLDFSKIQQGYDYRLEQAANSVLSKEYKRNDYNGRVVVKPADSRSFSWEVKAAALEAQLKSGGNNIKIPSAAVFADLMETADNVKQLNTLSRLTENPELNRAMNYGMFHLVEQAFDKVPACGDATQKLFYNIMYKLSIRPADVSLSRDSINYETLEAAKEECEAQRIVDIVSKQKEINAINKFDLVEKYRPEFLEQTMKMAPSMCEQVLAKIGHKLPVQTQLEMMTKVIGSFSKNVQNGGSLSDNEYYKLSSYLGKAMNLNTSSKAMAKFLETVRPIVSEIKQQNEKDKEYLAAAAVANQEKRAAEKDLTLFDKARNAYMSIYTIQEQIRNQRLKAKTNEPSDDDLQKFMRDGFAGLAVNISYEPKSGLGKLFMSKAVKEAQIELQNLTNKMNSTLADFAKTEEFKYAQEVSGSHDEYINERQEKVKLAHEKQQIIDDEFWYIKAEEVRVSLFEKYNIAEKLTTLEAQFVQRSDTMRGRAQTDLTMQFEGQEFNGKPMEGLVKENEMAQGIYKRKIEELRQAIDEGVKRDLSERGVNEKPNLDNPNEAGKPMTKESSKKLRNQMKDLKNYKELVH